ncbi:DNA-binding transcriptional regulator, AcrR family [Microlunatus sagamiharensis]|uniref:DNA-binding transcriptional regulator, AcrR family n=1 Tax=Microlunatus sagamiharensis TaxID=546874 RepID=A0A1H2N678_9ACTN|nr:TetR/AcrR family transcriptional regulator [Microlunatus sagamiharensis]SDV01063.1 DNA-binding transcriptional regulator, AcrR family [Microlunatus sagamiharensis]
MDAASESSEAAHGARRPGRPYDHSGDPAILAVTLDLLAERGYDQVTLDLVALRTGRAKTTLYRRWPTKADLVVAAVEAVGTPPEARELPDTGTVRSDLLAVVDSPWLGGPDRRMVLFDGLVTAAQVSPRVADAVRTTVTTPYVGVYEALLDRALARGQVSPGRAEAVPLVAQVIPAMASRGLAEGPVGRSYFVDVVDLVVLPALGIVG